MQKKDFKNDIKGADKLFSANDTEDVSNIQDYQNTLNTQDNENQNTIDNKLNISSIKDTEDIRYTQNSINTKNLHDKDFYRLNLKIDGHLKEYLKDAAWMSRMSITEYLNNLIRKDMKNHSNINYNK